MDLYLTTTYTLGFIVAMAIFWDCRTEGMSAIAALLVFVSAPLFWPFLGMLLVTYLLFKISWIVKGVDQKTDRERWVTYDARERRFIDADR